jgi:hypothetical protein
MRMGGIADEHVEWAVVNRLKSMLDDSPKTKFNVTQSFALFSTVLLWAKNRTWVGGDGENRPHWFAEADHAARDARERLRYTRISDPPWLLSRAPPNNILVDRAGDRPLGNQQINTDFAEMTAEDFFKWLRDALAHGDGRSIKPIHKFSVRRQKTLLAGFQIVFSERKNSDRNLALTLYHADMRRIGANLADLFCQSLSGGDRYFEQEAGTAKIEEAA